MRSISATILYLQLKNKEKYNQNQYQSCNKFYAKKTQFYCYIKEQMTNGEGVRMALWPLKTFGTINEQWIVL
jgi:hypothetical protein